MNPAKGQHSAVDEIGRQLKRHASYAVETVQVVGIKQHPFLADSVDMINAIFLTLLGRPKALLAESDYEVAQDGVSFLYKVPPLGLD